MFVCLPACLLGFLLIYFTYIHTDCLVMLQLILTLLNLFKQTKVSNSFLLLHKKEFNFFKNNSTARSRLVKSHVFGLYVIVCLSEGWDVCLKSHHIGACLNNADVCEYLNDHACKAASHFNAGRLYSLCDSMPLLSKNGRK